MQDTRSEDERLSTYLQFTPLASIYPPTSLNDVFLCPTVQSQPLEALHIDVAENTIGNAQVLDRIFKTTLSTASESHFLSADEVLPDLTMVSTSLSMDPQLSSVLTQYKSRLLELTLKTPTSPGDSHNSTSSLSALAIARSNEEQVDSASDRRTPIANKQPFVVEVDSTSKGDGASNSLTPTKRSRGVSQLSPTPTKLKRSKSSRVGSPGTPLKSDPYLASNRLIMDSTKEELQDIIDFIFEADDNMEADTSGRSQDAQQDVFDGSSAGRTTVNSDVLHKLLNALKKARQHLVLSQCDSDALLRLQRIVLRACTDSQDVGHTSPSAHNKERWDEEAKHELLMNLKRGRNAIMSCLVVIYTFDAAETNQQLCSEEVLLQLVDSMKFVIEVHIASWFTAFVTGIPSTDHKRECDLLIQMLASAVEHFSALLNKGDMSDNVLSRVEFLMTKIIFLEASSKADKTKISLEGLKVAAVKSLQQIFVWHPLQRSFILEEFLSSLGKLSVDKQSGRQYRLSNGKCVQLASITLLLLIQSTSTKAGQAKQHLSGPDVVKHEEQVSDTLMEDANNSLGIPPQLQPFLSGQDGSANAAQLVVHFLLARATKASKIGTSDESQFRALLDLFMEDFLILLLLPEWPSSELVLRCIAKSLAELVDDPKQTANVKAYALDGLSSIACKIRQICMQIQDNSGRLDDGLDGLVYKLPIFSLPSSISHEQLNGFLELQSVLCMYLSADPGRETAYEYSITSCLALLTKAASAVTVLQSKKLLYESAIMVAATYAKDDVTLWTTKYELPLAHTSLALIHLYLLSFSNLVQMSDAIIGRLLSAMESPHITMRTKSLRSFGNLALVDPTILSVKVVQIQVAHRISDPSPQVRDVAIDLIGKYVAANPELGAQYYGVLKARLTDTGTSVRKRVLRILRDLYLKTSDVNLKTDIVANFLRSLEDEEENVQELVYKLFEDVWFKQTIEGEEPLLSDIPAKSRTELISKALVFTKLASLEHSIPSLLRRLLEGLPEHCSGKVDYLEIIRLILQALVSRIIDDTDEVLRLGSLVAADILAQSALQLFSSSQLESLLPYIQRGTSKFEQSAPYYVASIYYSVFPRSSSLNQTFLGNVQASILSQLTKLPMRTLSKVVPCLCEIARLRSDYTRVAMTFRSCLAKLQTYAEQRDAGQFKVADGKSLTLLLHLVGLFTRYLEVNNAQAIQDALGVATPHDMVNKVVNCIARFFLADAVAASRKAALSSLGNVCIKYPDCFLSPTTLDLMDQVMSSSVDDCITTLIEIWIEYLEVEEKVHRANEKSQPKKQKAKEEKPDVGALTGNTEKNANDGIAPSIMQRYLSRILEVSLGTQIELASRALELIRQIVTLGLANPRNCVPTIIALETSSHIGLRTSATRIHQALDEKHESLIDSCYVDGVKSAFTYQMALGAGKLTLSENSLITTLYSIVRKSRQGRKKFLTTLTRALNCNLDKLSKFQSQDVQFAHFLAHNIGCTDYSTNEEVHFVIHALDRILSDSGVALLQKLDEQVASDTLESLIQAATIMCYVVQLRGHLVQLYNISDAKCRSFEPNRLGAKSDAKTAIKQTGVSLRPQLVSPTPATDEDRITTFKDLFQREEHQSMNIRDQEEDTKEDSVLVDMARSVATLDDTVMKDDDMNDSAED